MIESSGEFTRIIDQTKYFGQPAAIRAFNPSDKMDVQRLFDTIHSPQSEQYLLEVSDMNMDDVRRWSGRRGQAHRKQECMFAISGAAESVDTSEVGEVQGFMNSYLLDEDLRQRSIEAGLMEDSEFPIFEISTGKKPGYPQGVIESGIIQACFQLNSMVDSLHQHETLPQLQIVAYIEPNNTDAIKLIERCGFDKRGSIKYDVADPVEDNLYQINWEKAQQILHQAADPHVTST
jgi:hypothetical protein